MIVALVHILDNQDEHIQEQILDLIVELTENKINQHCINKKIVT